MSQIHQEPESGMDRARMNEKPQSEHDQQLPPGIVPEDPLNTDE